MVYSLKQTTDTSEETYLVGSATTFENIPTSATSVSTNKIAEQITVPANKTYTYTLTIQLVNSPTVDQTSDLNANFYTEFDIQEYVYESPIKCLDGSGNEISCPATFSVGDRIAIGDEVFRFIRYTSTSNKLNECGGETGTSTACGDATDGDIRALAEYNLYVGHIYDSNYNKTGDIATTDTKYGKQDSTARGWVDGASYFNGTTEFSSASVKGTQYTSYRGSIVEDYVEEYVQYLSDEYDATVSGGLITKYEIMSLCNLTGSGTCANTNPWVYTTSYWTGSPNATDDVWLVGSDASFDRRYCFNDAFYGVRPFITISASDI